MAQFQPHSTLASCPRANRCVRGGRTVPGGSQSQPQLCLCQHSFIVSETALHCLQCDPLALHPHLGQWCARLLLGPPTRAWTENCKTCAQMAMLLHLRGPNGDLQALHETTSYALIPSTDTKVVSGLISQCAGDALASGSGGKSIMEWSCRRLHCLAQLLWSLLSSTSG